MQESQKYSDNPFTYPEQNNGLRSPRNDNDVMYTRRGGTMLQHAFVLNEDCGVGDGSVDRNVLLSHLPLQCDHFSKVAAAERQKGMQR